MTAKQRFACVALAELALLAGGCGLKQPYPEKELYAIDVTPPAQAESAAADRAVLRVYRFLVTPPYNAQPFIYRAGDDRYETDYYHGFVADPGNLLTGETVTWLDGSGLFAVVVPSTGRGGQDYTLEANVIELYGDYRDARAPKAVMAVKFFLLDNTGEELTVAHQQTYTRAVAITEARPAELVKGWNQAYADILAELVEDLRALSLSRQRR